MKIYITKLFLKYLLFLLIGIGYIHADSFENNFYNNHGVVGLINIPTARFYDEGVHGTTLYDGTPDQKITLTSSPYNWLEASFYYTNLQDVPYCEALFDPVCQQDYKDKGFNIKLRIKDEGVLPAIAIGLNDFAGTGYYSSEYIVGSYGIKNIDFHFGLGWGLLSGADKKIKNPLGYLNDSFYSRPIVSGLGGSFNPKVYFSGQNASPFFGISYRLKDKIFFNIERDTTLVGTKMPYPDRESNYSFGINYVINDNFTLGTSYERGNYVSFKFTYKNNPKSSIKKYEYQEGKIDNDDDKYEKLVKNLEENGIGVNKIIESSRSIGLDLTQFVHSDITVIEEIIRESSRDAGIEKNIKKDIRIADLNAVSEIDETLRKNANTIYQRDTSRTVNTFTRAKFRPFIASREEFFKGAFLIENDTEFVLRENLFFNTNLKYSIANNFDDLRYPPVNTFPAQVRSDVKQYLKNMDKGVLVGRAQLDYHLTPKKNHHIMLTGGILEDMFSGYGMEYLFFKPNTNYSLGFEIFSVQKRDYEWGFGHLDYKNTIANLNFYYRNFGSVPFDMKITAGEYLAGDIGSTIELSRTFSNGVRYGVFATLTDVSSEEFGEGSFDKGLFFKIPIYGNLIDYTWRPLTKDPGAKLIRKNTLHDLLVRFKPLD